APFTQVNTYPSTVERAGEVGMVLVMDGAMAAPSTSGAGASAATVVSGMVSARAIASTDRWMRVAGRIIRCIPRAAGNVALGRRRRACADVTDRWAIRDLGKGTAARQRMVR